MSKPTLSANIHGSNQYQSQSVLEDLPNLRDILQGYIDERVQQKDIPEAIQKDHGVTIKLRTVQKYMKELGVLTSRRNGLTVEQQELAIDMVTEDDPLGRWGAQSVQEKLGSKSIHIPRDAISLYRLGQDKQAQEARHPHNRKLHHTGLWSIGPNEEWGVDGHEKIRNSMGIAIWGIIDKCSRMELGLWAMPNARVQEVPPALYLRLVKQKGGMSLTTTSDKGSELGLLISLVTTLRHKMQPFLPEDQLPAFKAVKSVYNITSERGWCPIWEKELGNVAHEYQLGMVGAGYIANDPVHSAISFWLWGRIVQERLDEFMHQNHIHRIRKQKTLLPSGGRRIDIYNNPEKFGSTLKDRLIHVPAEVIDELLEKYDRPDLLQFGTDDTVRVMEEVFREIGSPKLSAKVGWSVFVEMVTKYIELDTAILEEVD